MWTECCFLGRCLGSRESSCFTPCLATMLQYIDKDFWYENFTEEEQNKILKAQRSNNTLVSGEGMSCLPATWVGRRCIPALLSLDSRSQPRR